MKIVHVCETAIGGIASYFNIICEVDKGYANIIVAPEGHTRGIDPTLDIRPYKATGRNMGSIWNMIRATHRVIRAEKPDIVFFHSSFSLLALLGMRLAGVRTPTIYSAHGWSAWIYPEGSLKNRIVKVIEGTLCGLASRVVNISTTDGELAKENRYFGRHVVIENAVQERSPEVQSTLFHKEANCLHLLFIGRFDRQKGLDVLLPAFARAQEDRPDLKLHIVGASIRADGGAIVLPEGASLSGWVDKVRIDDWYASADALIVPSRWEGLPLVIPEALRNGTPVLCSNRGTLPSLIQHGTTGEVFELTEDAIVDCLIRLDKADLRSRRTACRALYEKRFSFARFAPEIRELYQDVVAPRKDPKKVG